MRTRAVWWAALLALAGCGVLPGCAGRGSGAGPPSHARPATLPLESRPVVLRCADAARDLAAPAPTFLHVEGLASDGWAPLGALPDLGPVSAGGRPYRFVTAFLYLTLQAAPQTTVSVLSPAGAWLYYTDFGTWSGGNPLVAPVPRGPSKQVTVGACPADGRPAGYPGGVLVPGPTCVTLLFTRSDSRTGRTATFRYGVPAC